MKACPVCEARAFDDADTCYGCLHRFEGQSVQTGALPSNKAVLPEEPRRDPEESRPSPGGRHAAKSKGDGCLVETGGLRKDSGDGDMPSSGNDSLRNQVYAQTRSQGCASKCFGGCSKDGSVDGSGWVVRVEIPTNAEEGDGRDLVGVREEGRMGFHTSATKPSHDQPHSIVIHVQVPGSPPVRPAMFSNDAAPPTRIEGSLGKTKTLLRGKNANGMSR